MDHVEFVEKHKVLGNIHAKFVFRFKNTGSFVDFSSKILWLFLSRSLFELSKPGLFTLTFLPQTSIPPIPPRVSDTVLPR